jgi:hypothetical protein
MIIFLKIVWVMWCPTPTCPRNRTKWLTEDPIIWWHVINQNLSSTRNIHHIQWILLHVAFLSSLRFCFYLTHQLLPVSFYGNWKHYLQISNLCTQAYRNVCNGLIIMDFEGVVLSGWSTTKNFLVTHTWGGWSVVCSPCCGNM